MNRSLCNFTLRQVRHECLPCLRTIARIGLRSRFHHSSLCRVRDVLSNACNTFAEDEAVGYFEDEYLACFDALACVNEALIRHSRGRHFQQYMREAVEFLERLEDSTAVI